MICVSVLCGWLPQKITSPLVYRLSYVDLKCWMGKGKSHQGIELIFRMQLNEVWEDRLKAKFLFLFQVVEILWWLWWRLQLFLNTLLTAALSVTLIHEASGVFSEKTMYFSC